MSRAFEAIRNERGFMRHHELYPLLGIRAGDHLPKEGFRKTVGDVELRCKPADGNGRRSQHRIMVQCTCGKEVPFGRMGQHLRGKAHR